MAGIADIGFLTRPVRGYAGGDLVINPPTAAEELGISDVKTPFMEEYAKNLEDASQFAVDHAVGELENQIAEELRSKYKVEFDWKGFKNWMMGKNPDGSSKLKAGKLPKDWEKQNRKQLGKLLDKIPAGSLRRSVLSSVIKSGIKLSSPIAETIQGYLERSEQTTKQIQQGKEIDEAIAKMSELGLLVDKETKKPRMTGKEIQIYLKDNFDLNVTDRSIYRKIQKNKIPVKPKVDWKIRVKLRKAFNEIGNKDYFKTITEEELWAMPQIQKIAEEGYLTPETLSQLRTRMEYPIKRSWVNFFDKVGVDHDEVVKYMEENNVRTDDLIQKFPKLQQAVDEGKIEPARITAWRGRNDLSYDDSILKSSRKKILQERSPELSKYLEFKPQSGEGPLPSNVPIKHFKDFGKETIRTRDDIPTEVVQTRISQGHAIGEFGIPGVTKSKAKMIPEKSRKGVNLREQILEPNFYLTPTENSNHRAAENKLVTALVKKYKLLGWEFIEENYDLKFDDDGYGKGEWVETEKKSMLDTDKIKELEKYEDTVANATEEIKKLDAFTKFYNPVTDELVTYGKSEAETLPLSNFMNQVLRGEKKFEQGGMVGMDYLNRPI